MSEERKNHRSGRCLRTEPEGLDALRTDKTIEEAFKKVGCWRFCEKLQGGHNQVTKEFALNFTGLHTKIGVLELPISLEVISLVTEIPRGREKWFKNFKFEMEHCKIFLKPEFVDIDLTKAVQGVMSKIHMPTYSHAYKGTSPMKEDTTRCILIISNSYCISLG